MEELTIFRRNALMDGLCKDWSQMWAACHGEKDKLMRLVLMQQSAPYFATYCYNGRGLSKEYCKREFSDYINGRVFHDCDKVEGYSYGMFIDAPESLEIALDVAQMLWCRTDVTVLETKCPTIYVSNYSDVTVSCEGYNSVRVYLFDESTLTIEDADETCDVIVYKYSNRANVETGKYCLAKVKVFLKELRL